ncbi:MULTISPECIES: SMC family ATPase [Anaerolinea]|uniref:AAA family ATPase n=1 Tax=Anaerolinea TaxID=233189 RepID=UPI0026159D38|nr:SMC family ATPase [Anaerolinea thermophila]
MIPKRLYIEGFLSYRQAVEVNLEDVSLACISGSNGAGKSSLLDAITWALFGKARSRDDALINSTSDKAVVQFVFEFEKDTYRVVRIKPRNKSTVLEFWVLDSKNREWTPLTRATLTATEQTIRSVLRMDFETFVNASFFLQGGADRFAQQNPAERKKILSSILGLEIWEEYRERVAVRRRDSDAQEKSLTRELAEIEQELKEEPARKQMLKEAQEKLKSLTKEREALEKEFHTLERLKTALDEQKHLLDVLRKQDADIVGRIERLKRTLIEQEERKARLEARLSEAETVDQRNEEYQQARRELERWEKLAAEYLRLEQQRAVPLQQIAAARAGLEQEKSLLEQQAQKMTRNALRQQELEALIQEAQEKCRILEDRVQSRPELEAQIGALQDEMAQLKAENDQRRQQMNEIKDRIERLSHTSGAVCPLCGQPLGEEDRRNLVASLEQQGKQLADAYRAAQASQKQCQERALEVQTALKELDRIESEWQTLKRQIEVHTAERTRLQDELNLWQSEGALRLQEVTRLLAEESFAVEARALLAQLDARVNALQYNPQLHEECRIRVQSLAWVENALQEVQTARAELEPLNRQIEETRQQLALEQQKREEHLRELRRAEEKVQSDMALLPDLDEFESKLRKKQLEENQQREEVARARQWVQTLEQLKGRKQEKEAHRKELLLRLQRLSLLERACGKDGVPALLIEQALPQIEEHANQLLERLSNGMMLVRFSTQRALKTRDEQKETLDIIISDSVGERPYEMFSGGEAFRINFAIRLALSRVLAHRSGARLQTLFIDEGFGSQDADGRQRLIEAINQIRNEFECILVITHLEDMKDAFPARIEVEKTLSGSQVRVIQ